MQPNGQKNVFIPFQSQHQQAADQHNGSQQGSAQQGAYQYSVPCAPAPSAFVPQPYLYQPQSGPPSTGSMQGFYQPQPQQSFMGQAPANGFAPTGAAGAPLVDPFVSQLATQMIRPNLDSALHRGQAFMQSSFSFLSPSALHYHFNINSEYVRKKLLMLFAPYLRRWQHARMLEQLSGGHKYLPPRQDVNAPDLYIPLMAMWTYCSLKGAAAVSRNAFKPDVMYSAVSWALGAWFFHFALLKGLMYMSNISSAIPILEAIAYTGYAFVPVSVCLSVKLVGGSWMFYGTYIYLSLCMAMMLVQTIKRVVFQESQTYNLASTAYKYWLLVLAAFQFAFVFLLTWG